MEAPEWIENAFDKFTRFFTVISGDHRYTHAGRGFIISGKTASLAQNATETLQFTTPPSRSGLTTYAHFRPPTFASSASLAEGRFAEASTVSGGTPVIPINKRRNASPDSLAVVKSAVTLSVEGTVLAFSIAGSGGNPASIRGGSSGDASDQEIVLKPNTTYSLRMENLGASATVIYYSLTWYEELRG